MSGVRWGLCKAASMRIDVVLLICVVLTWAWPAMRPAELRADSLSTGGGRVTIGYQSLRRPATVVPAGLVIQQGDTPAGAVGPIAELNAPQTNGQGAVGFTGVSGSELGEFFVWHDSGICWSNGDAVSDTLSMGETSLGIGDGGRFIYSPLVNGKDSLWTHNGLLQLEETQAPGFPAGVISTFHSRPVMLPAGQVYWVAGFNASGGSATEGRVLYHSTDALSDTITVVLRSDELIDGYQIARPGGIQFDYQVSDNGAHHIQELQMVTGSTSDDSFVYLDGSLLMQESRPSGDGDNWDNFDLFGINDAGNYLFSGDTDGDTDSDEFIAYNGNIALREGDTIDGVELTAGATVQALSLNNENRAVHSWRTGSGVEALFFACRAAQLVSSTLMLATGDMLDLDGDLLGDATVTDMNAVSDLGPGISLAGDGYVYLEVDLDYGAGPLEAIIGLVAPACPQNMPPTANDDQFQFAEDTVLTVPAPGVLNNDLDAELAPLVAILAAGPDDGALAWPGDGSFVFTPTLDMHGVVSMTYQAHDGELVSDAATVTLIITAVNDAPLAMGDTLTRTRNAPLLLPAPGVLANDSDVDGDLLLAVLDQAPARGSLSLSLDGALIYTPTIEGVGDDLFFYHVTDTVADSESVPVVIRVAGGLERVVYLPLLLRQAQRY